MNRVGDITEIYHWNETTALIPGLIKTRAGEGEGEGEGGGRGLRGVRSAGEKTDKIIRRGHVDH